MADSTYRIILDYVPQGTLLPGGAGAKLGEAHGSVASLKNAANELWGSFDKVIDKAVDLGVKVAKIGGATAFAAATYGVVGLNAKLEDTQIALATIFSANGVVANVPAGMTLAGSVLTQMRKDAAALPGEFSDLTTIFRSIALPGFQAGAGVDQIEKLAAKAMAAGAVAGLGSDVVGREFAMLLQGRAGAHNVLGMQLFGLGGEQAKAFNKMSAPERLEFLTKGLDKFAGSIDQFSHSFAGLSSTLLDNAKHFLQLATAPLFDRVKGTLSELNDWFDRNQGKIEELAADIGGRLAEAWTFVVDKAKEFAPTLDRVKDAIDKWATSDGLKKIEHIAILLAALKGGSMLGHEAANVGGAGLNLLGGVAKIAPLLGGGAGAAGGEAAAGAAAGLGTASIVALPAVAGILIGIGEAAAGVGLAMRTAKDDTSIFQAGVIADFKSLEQDGSRISTALAETWAQVGPKIMTAIEPVANAFGSTVVFALRTAGDAVASFASDVAIVAQPVAEVTGTLEVLAGIATMAAGGLNTLAGAIANLGTAAGKSMDKSTMDAGTAAAAGMRKVFAKLPAGGGGGGGGTHIQKVEIVVSSNQDPSRIARLTMGELEKLARHPKSSGGVRNYSRR